MWFICLNKQCVDSFTQVHPIKYFWKDVIKNYLFDIIEFDNKKYKIYFV